jgi:hypothetical protein
MKKNLILSFISLLVVISLATFSVYAWFKVGTNEFKNVVFTSGNMNVTSEFWMIKDNNRDGYYDYNPDGSLTLIDTKNMLTGDENIISPQLAVEGDIFSYRFLVKSASTIPVALTIRLDNLDSKINDIITWNYGGYTRYQSLTMSDITMLDDYSNLDDPDFFTKISVSKSTEKIYNNIQIVTKENEIIMYPQDVFVFDFQIKFEYLTWLREWNPTLFNDATDLSVYSNATFNATTIYIEFVSL